MIIVRHGEIYTKSPPVRRQFISRLAENIRRAVPGASVERKRWRLFVRAKDEAKALGALAKVPGIVSFSPAVETGQDMGQIKKEVTKLFPRIRGKGFAVRAKRLSKEFMESRKINEEIGAFIKSGAKARVELDKPDITVGIEIYGGKAYVFIDSYPGVGGLPGSTAGKMKLLKSKNSALAAWMMEKRGIEISDRNVLGSITGETDIQKIIALTKKSDIPVYAPLMGLDKRMIKEFKDRMG
jgi:thiamine biosynthesis protein ThiI